MVLAEKGIITLAYGAPKYIEMAKTLGRSLLLHSPSIPRAVVTDRQDDKELAELFDQLIPYNAEYGSNVRQKIHLDQYSPYTRTLFIDSDCIVVRDLSFVFECFAARNFAVVGGKHHLKSGDKDPYLDVDFILKSFRLSKLPKFNGGIYYFDDSDTARSIFKTARGILRDFDKLGFAEFRGDGPNEEPILATSMELHQQGMFQDNGSIMRTPVGLRGALKMDALAGKCTFKKGSRVVSPAVVHFAYIWSEHPVYHREVERLRVWTKTGEVHQIRTSWRTTLNYHLNVANYGLKRIHQRTRAFFKRAIAVF
jgi:hypothetical protein